jgi:hypothetical protein
MRRVIVLSAIYLMTFQYAFCQTKPDTISFIKGNYTINGKILTPNEMLDMMKNYPDPYKEMNIARTNYDVARIFGFIGGFCIGYPIGQVLAKGNLNLAMVVVGAVCILISIPFIAGYSWHAKAAAGLYNSRLRKVGLKDIKFNMGLTSNRIGICCRF